MDNQNKAPPAALAGVRICDFTGQLAGAGATKWLAAFGAEVIRIEDPVRQGRWDILRGRRPVRGRAARHRPRRRLQQPQRREARNHAQPAHRARPGAAGASWSRSPTCVTENFAAGVLERMGFGYERLKAIRPDIIYVSNCGFGHIGPTARSRPGARSCRPCRADLHLRAAGPAAGGVGLLLHGPQRRLLHGHRHPGGPGPPDAHRRGPVGRHGLHRGRRRPARPALLD